MGLGDQLGDKYRCPGRERLTVQPQQGDEGREGNKVSEIPRTWWRAEFWQVGGSQAGISGLGVSKLPTSFPEIRNPARLQVIWASWLLDTQVEFNYLRTCCRNPDEPNLPFRLQKTDLSNRRIWEEKMSFPMPLEPKPRLGLACLYRTFPLCDVLLTRQWKPVRYCEDL